LYVVGESTLTPAPAGSHITRENLKVTVDAESVIIAIESGDTIAEDAVESSAEEMAEVGSPESGITEEPASGVESENDGLDRLLGLLGPMIEEMTKMKSEMESMKGKMSADLLALKNDFNSFKKSPEKFSVIEKKTMTESFEDYKLELIKSLRK
jgi:hypothetical protein